LIDWAAIKQEYMTTDISYRRLGDKHGIHFKKIARVAKRENWVEARRQWRATRSVAGKYAENRPHSMPLAALRQAAENLSELLEQVTRCTDTFYNEGELNARTMQQTVSALKDLTAIARHLYDIPADKESESLTEEPARCGVVEIGATLTSARSAGCSE